MPELPPPRATRAFGTSDTVITGVVVIDRWGIVEADVGIRDSRIRAIGKAANPDTMNGVHPDLMVGPNTENIPGNGRILTAGAIDFHALHLSVADGRGARRRHHHLDRRRRRPAEGSEATTVTPGSCIWPGCWRPLTRGR